MGCRRRIVLGLVLGCAFLGGAAILPGCASPTTARPVDTTLKLTPPTTTTPPPSTTVIERPKNLALWAHIDQPEALLEIFGLTGSGSGSASGSSSSLSGEIAPYLELIDLGQPIDGVLIARSEHVRDVDPAIRIHFKDSKALFTLLSKEFQLREQGDRVVARSRRDGDGDSSASSSRSTDQNQTPNTKDEWECDFVRGSDTAVCGSPAAVGAVADWLKTGPIPPGGPARPHTIARLTAYPAPLRDLAEDLFGSSRRGAQDSSELAAFLRDGDELSLDLAADGDRLDLLAKLHLVTSHSRVAKDLLATPNAAHPSEAFYRIWQESIGALFTPGGGAMPKWVADVVRQSRDEKGTPAERTRRDAAGAVIGDAFTKPAAIGYSVRTDRVRAAIANVRSSASSSRDPRGSLAKLEDALEGQVVFALDTPIATLERALRDYASLSVAGSPGKYSVRAAASANGKPTLPKGSFFFEERSPDWIRASTASTAAPSLSSAATSGKPPAPPMRVSYTLFVAGASPGSPGPIVWGAGCLSEEVCIEVVQKLMASSSKTSAPTSATSDPFFERPNIIAAGYLPIASATSQSQWLLRTGHGGGALPPNVLTDIERDLALPRPIVPFVITSVPDGRGGGGGGGLITGEIRGTTANFRRIVEHGGSSGAWRIAALLLAVFGSSP